MPNIPRVYLVDPDPDTPRELAPILTPLQVETQSFESPSAFLEAYDPKTPACVLSDIALGEMTGLALLQGIRERKWTVPVIFLSAFRDVSLAVKAMKHGAQDYLTKPATPHSLEEAIRQALHQDVKRKKRQQTLGRIQQLIDSLSEREREVMRLITKGLLSKAIAQKLDISPRTVEFHRANIMKKMHVRSLAELISQLVIYGFH